MADDSMSEDQWLYGDSTNEENKPGDDTGGGGDTANGDQLPLALPTLEKEAAKAIIGKPEDGDQTEAIKNGTDEGGIEAGEIPKEQDEFDGATDAVTDPKKETGEGEDDEEEEDDDDDDDDSDDNVHVTIGDIKTTVGGAGGGAGGGGGQAAQQYNIKRGVLPASSDKIKQQPGKFSIEEFESIGTINGLPAHEFSIDALEEKPWRKPGADITDYFNYGFNEETWRAYCERQKTMRMHESGVGLGGLGVSSRGGTAGLGVVGGSGSVIGGGSLGVSALPVVNDNSKYSGVNSTVLIGGVGVGPGGVGGVRKAGPPPGPRRSGVIDVIGGSGVASRRATDSPPKENAIQVMTADKRDYGRKNFDMSIPPPGFETSQAPIAPVVPSYPPHPSYNPEFYNPEVDSYYQAYEPTQDLQWNSQGWSRRRSRVDSKSPTRLSSHHLHSNHGYLSSSSYRSKSSLEHRSRGSSIPKETILPDGVVLKQEPLEKGVRGERDRERERHKERHRHRSRSRSGERSERRSRKHKSRSRSPGSHRSHKKKKSKKSERPKDNSD